MHVVQGSPWSKLQVVWPLGSCPHICQCHWWRNRPGSWVSQRWRQGESWKNHELTTDISQWFTMSLFGGCIYKLPPVCFFSHARLTSIVVWESFILRSWIILRFNKASQLLCANKLSAQNAATWKQPIFTQCVAFALRCTSLFCLSLLPVHKQKNRSTSNKLRCRQTERDREGEEREWRVKKTWRRMERSRKRRRR